jgi:hypothetical protein
VQNAGKEKAWLKSLWASRGGADDRAEQREVFVFRSGATLVPSERSVVTELSKDCNFFKGYATSSAQDQDRARSVAEMRVYFFTFFAKDAWEASLVRVG